MDMDGRKEACADQALVMNWVRAFVMPPLRPNDPLVNSRFFRLSENWEFLDGEVWPRLRSNAEARGATRWPAAYSVDWFESLVASVCAAAIRFEINRFESIYADDGFGDQGIKQEAKEFLALELKINELARDLAENLRRRDQLAEERGLSALRNDPGLGLWEVLASVAGERREFAAWFELGGERFLGFSCETSQPSPDLADVLENIADQDFGDRVENLLIGRSGRHPVKVVARTPEDCELLRLRAGSRSDNPDALNLRLLFSRLDEIRECDGLRCSALSLLDEQILAPLLAIVLGYQPDSELGADESRMPPKSFRSENVRKALQAFRARSGNGT